MCCFLFYSCRWDSGWYVWFVLGFFNLYLVVVFVWKPGALGHLFFHCVKLTSCRCLRALFVWMWVSLPILLFVLLFKCGGLRVFKRCPPLLILSVSTTVIVVSWAKYLEFLPWLLLPLYLSIFCCLPMASLSNTPDSLCK